MIRLWTTREEKYLAANAATVDSREIAHSLQRSHAAIATKASRMGIKLVRLEKRVSEAWGHADLLVISRAVKLSLPVECVIKKLPHRTPGAVANMYYKTRKEMTK